MLDPVMAQVSIILPTYNRARFLPQAFDSIVGQTLDDWELIIVDDGSTDETASIVREFQVKEARSVRYVQQTNQGPAAARNAGLDLARAPLIAFFDSDDCWLPHHLQDCARALDGVPEVDWVFAPYRLVRFSDRHIAIENSFFPKGAPRSFLSLQRRGVGPLWMIDDPGAVRNVINDNQFAGLPPSVVRAKVFQSVRLPMFRAGEDAVFAIETLARGFRAGYLNDVHYLYYLHDDHVSNIDDKAPVAKRAAYQAELVNALSALDSSGLLTGADRTALRARLFRETFWTLGYGLYWLAGMHREAIGTFEAALRRSPFNLASWKTYFVCRARTAAMAFSSSPLKKPPA